MNRDSLTTRVAGVLDEAAGSARETERLPYRHREMEWLSAHAPELVNHAGKWIVLEGDSIVASDPDYQVARGQAVARGITRPLIFFIPQDNGSDGFIGGFDAA
jgi:hypothetical protein